MNKVHKELEKVKSLIHSTWIYFILFYTRYFSSNQQHDAKENEAEPCPKGTYSLVGN